MLLMQQQNAQLQRTCLPKLNIPQAIPILSKSKHVPGLDKPKLLLALPPDPAAVYRLLRQRKQSQLQQDLSFFGSKFAEPSKVVFKRFCNDSLNYCSRINKKVFASIFITLTDFTPASSLKSLVGAEPGLSKSGRLVFSSQFESGNLLTVVQAQQNEYQLLMHNDINSSVYSQWFYFKVEGNPGLVKFSVVNMGKQQSLFSQGMQPFVRTTVGWRREGQNVSYYRNSTKKQQGEQFFCTLRFSLQLEEGVTQVAYSPPYTYSQLASLIKEVKPFYTVSSLGKSLSGRDIPLLQLGDDILPVIFVIGRQHSGQSPGSYIVEGLVQQLVKSRLTEYFCFKIVPMVNVDGVVFGNYRSNLAGLDLNRHWFKPDESCKEIQPIRQLLRELKDKVALFIDVHAHTQMTHTFFYGNPGPHESRHNPSCKLLPLIMHRLDPRFSYKNSSFVVAPGKENTARVFVSKLIKGLSYTVQTSFWGWRKTDSDEVRAFGVEDYLDMGRSLLIGIDRVKFFLLNRIGLAIEPPGPEKQLQNHLKQVLVELHDHDGESRREQLQECRSVGHSMLKRNISKLSFFEKYGSRSSKHSAKLTNSISNGKRVSVKLIPLLKDEVLSVESGGREQQKPTKAPIRKPTRSQSLKLPNISRMQRQRVSSLAGRRP